MPTAPDTETKQSTHVYISAATKTKLEQIQAVKRWNQVTTVDALCDHFIATDPQMRGEVPAVGQHLDVSA